MYRQVWCHPQDQKYQRIVWRESVDDPFQDFELLTITYGTSSAPHSATKCLKQLADDEEDSLPMAAEITRRDFYMDDLLSGASNLDDGIKIQDQLIELMKRGKFELRKWAASHPQLLDRLPAELRAVNGPIRLDVDDVIKTLGIQWNFNQDCFSFSVTPPVPRDIVSRRSLLSDIAKIFDPLGWLSPVTINAKMLLQEIWTMDNNPRGWDDPVSGAIRSKWIAYCQGLQDLEKIKIKRCIKSENSTHPQLHGFCDASEKAYCAAVYYWSRRADGTVEVNLVAAKTKVAPLQQISLPRLELCGAVLLSRLLKTVQESLKVDFDEIHGWTDSTIVLSWLAAHPKRWKTFVANRVSEVQTLLPSINWHHVISEENPADCGSRGMPFATLPSYSLWWNGPKWLQEMEYPIPNSKVDFTVGLEEQKQVTVGHVNIEETLLSRYSSLSKLVGVTACCLRLVYNLRTPRKNWRKGPLTPEERENVLFHWIKIVQSSTFSEEKMRMTQGEPISPKSKLVTLTPWIDDDGLIRVGGRLRHSHHMSDLERQQIILPSKNHLTRLIIMDHHQKNLHAGASLLLSTVRQKFWILSGRREIQCAIRKCICCTRYKSSHPQPVMGDLPSARVNPARAFQQCGVDYAGPILLRKWIGKGHRCVKGYIAVFTCFTTKAVHLELVSALTTNAFMAALDRFVSIRGKPTDLYSDCGRNFLGASRVLKRMVKSLLSSAHHLEVATQLSKEGINWHFNPPSGPHFAGLWEAAIKSAKFHLNRVVGTSSFTIEEMSTLLAKISACLNSRPLCPMSNDPNDFQVLTPGHFLIGEPLNALPQRHFVKLNRLNRWQLLQQQSQRFWERWSREYLSQLQQKVKCTSSSPSADIIKIGDLVLLMDNLQPPSKWKMGRIDAVHPGADGIIRVVTIRTTKGLIKRPVVKIAPLPVE